MKRKLPLRTQHRAANDNAVSWNKTKAVRAGLTGEKLVRTYHAQARASGIAYLFKVPTPTAGFPPHLRYCAASVVDHVGFMLDGSGRFIAEEVKTCSSKKSFAMSEVEPHQRAFLDAVHDAGGVALLTIVWGADRHVCPLEWDMFRDCPTIAGADLVLKAVTPNAYLADLVFDGRPAPYRSQEPESLEPAAFAAALGLSMKGKINYG